MTMNCWPCILLYCNSQVFCFVFADMFRAHVKAGDGAVDEKIIKKKVRKSLSEKIADINRKRT